MARGLSVLRIQEGFESYAVVVPKSRSGGYWIVDPDQTVINIFRPAADGLYSEVVAVIPGQKVRVGIFPNLEIDTTEVFAA